MNESKLKKYTGKRVKVYFRYKRKPETGRVVYMQNGPLTGYCLQLPQYISIFDFSYYIPLNPKMIGHIEIRK